MTFDHRTLKILVERRHPEYECLVAHWDFLELAYRGGREWFKGNIFRYFKEGPGEYRDRVKRAYRFNHSREVVDLVNKYLFRGNINRNEDDAPQCVKDFWKRSTKKGLDIKEFMRVVSTRASVLGRPWVIVDNANRNAAAPNASKADEIPNSIYVYVVNPQDVLDLSWGDDGELNWILIRENHRDDENPFGNNGDVERKYRLWTRNDWYLISKASNGRTYEVEDSGTHGLGEVPAVPADNSPCDDEWSCPALIADIAYLDRSVANYASNLDAIIQDQTFSQLAMPAQNVLPGEDAYEKIKEMGTKRIFLYDGEGGTAPGYLSPDPRQAALILAAITTLIGEIYHSVGLAGERTTQDTGKGIDNSSGVAKDKDFERVVALLASKADALETVENKISRLVCKWSGEDAPADDLVSYPETFDVRGLWDEFDVATRLSVVNAPESVRALHMEELVKKLFPNLGKDLVKKLKADIASWESDLKEKSALELQTPGKANLLGEAKRNRGASGKTQSATKSRETGKTQ